MCIGGSKGGGGEVNWCQIRLIYLQHHCPRIPKWMWIFLKGEGALCVTIVK